MFILPQYGQFSREVVPIRTPTGCVRILSQHFGQHLVLPVFFVLAIQWVLISNCQETNTNQLAIRENQ